MGRAMSDIISHLALRIAALPQTQGRRLVAIAGAPAGGKSFLAADLVSAVNSAGCTATVVQMDGFHLDNALLDMQGLRHRKGAPETFDVEGFIALMQRLKDGAKVVYPLFDRQRDLAIAGAAAIPEACNVVIVEGNYLLFDEAPWSSLAAIWDFSIWLDIPEDVLKDRLLQRWLDHGHTEAEALERAQSNDLPNARRILKNRLPADMTLALGDGLTVV